jgi:hypothetical protein
MLKELLMSSIKGEVKKKHFYIGRNFSCLMTSECWLSHIADSSFSCYYPVALSDTLGHDAIEDQVLISRLIGMYGPPQSCKRKMKNGSWSAPMYSAFSGVTDSGP